MSEEYNEWYWKLYRWFLWDVKHVHKTVWTGIKNLWRWFPIIWKDRDWDYYYIFQVLKFKLEKQAKHLGGRDAELMMTCVRLINKLQNEEYYEEYYDSRPMNNEMMYKCQAQHDKAKRLLFKIMNDRIDSWWD
jgi:hypothetical protein